MEIFIISSTLIIPTHGNRAWCPLVFLNIPIILDTCIVYRYTGHMSSVDQGRRGEASTVAYFVKEGYEVFLPMFGNASCDLIVVKDGKISRVECKSTSVKTPSGKWIAQLRQVRHNRTANTVKKFDSNNSELLAIYVVDEDRVVVLESIEVHGNSTVTVA